MFNSEAVNYILYLCREALREGWKGIRIKLDTYVDNHKDCRLEDRPYSYYSASEVERLLKARGLWVEDISGNLLIQWDDTKVFIHKRLEIKYWEYPKEIHIGPDVTIEENWKEGIKVEPQVIKIVLVRDSNRSTGLPQHALQYLIDTGWSCTLATDEGVINPFAPLVYSEEYDLLEVMGSDNDIRTDSELIKYAESNEDLIVKEITIPQGVKWYVLDERIEFSIY
jgi:hypothetical protein